MVRPHRDATMQALIERLRHMPGVQVTDRAADWIIAVTNMPGVRFEVLILRTVLQWFVTARNSETGAALWSDWVDYTGYARMRSDRPRGEPAEAMRTHIEWFLTTLARATDFRVTSEGGLGRTPQGKAEWRLAGEWRPMALIPRPTG
jgi:hypothetical protein